MSSFQQPLPPPPPRGRRKSSGAPLIVLLIVVLIVVAGIGFLALLLVEPRGGNTMDLFSKRVAVVEIIGAIYDAEDWVELIEECADSESIAAMVLHIDSPGGAIAPTQEIYEAARKVSDEGKPVVAYMGSVAASGGYYAACAADEVFAMPGTLTGSIGVYMQMMNVSDLLERVGVEFDTVKKGAFKTAGDFSRDMKPSERSMFQSVVDDYYGQFIDAVVESRNRNKISMARGWNESLPGGVVGSTTEVTETGGVLYPSAAWSSLGFTIPSVVSVTSVETSPEDATATIGIATETEAVSAEALPEVKKEKTQDKKKSADDKLNQMLAESLTEEAIRKRVESMAEGRIYTGRQAEQVGLVDKIGTLDDAIERAAELADIDADPKTITKKKRESGGLFGVKLNSSLFQEGSRFLYLCPFGM